MKILVAVAVFFLLSTQLFAEEIGTNDDLNYWSDWSDSDQIKVRPNRAWELFPSPCGGTLTSPSRETPWGVKGVIPQVPHKALSPQPSFLPEGEELHRGLHSQSDAL